MTLARRILDVLASLKLTVLLFALAMFLIFAGTLAQTTQGIWQVMDGYFRSGVAWVDLQLFIPRQWATVSTRFPFPGGGTLCALMIVNLLAAHIVRFKATRRRIGIVILHAGLILLLVGEFVTGWFANEGLMAIDEGKSSNFVEDVREVELAVVDRSPPEHDAVVAVPESKLTTAGRTIDHPALPFAVTVEEWMVNSQLRRSDTPSKATQGIGTGVEVQALPEVSGVDGAQSNSPSAFVTLRKGDQPLGTWLVSVNLGPVQTVTVDGKAYDLALRFKRTYKPYTLHLLDFSHDKFVGTEVARNFSSRVRVVDPSRGTDREVLIYMNNPLRYAGETFYQASFKPDDSGTILQVVRNPGWLIPYIACALVSVGMVVHFVMSLTAFLRRQGKGAAKAAALEPSPATTEGSGIGLWGLGAAALGLLVALSPLFAARVGSGEYDIRTFARIPVSADGRVKPIDTVARNALMIASGRQTVRNAAGKKIAPAAFLLDLMARPEVAKEYEVVRVDHPDVLTLLGRSATKPGRLTLAELEPAWPKIVEQVQRASEVPARQRDPFQRAVVELFEKVSRLLDLSRMRAPYAIPPLAEGETWQPFHEAFLAVRVAMTDVMHDEEDRPRPHPAVGHVVEVMTAYHEQQPQQFNQAVAAYESLVHRALPHDSFKAKVEVLFNRAAPFYGATIVYLLALLAGLLAVLLRSRAATAPEQLTAAERARRIAVGLLWAALVVQTIAIALRIYLQGRPPVTNLYSSAIFVGWAAVLMALLMERIFPLGLAALGAAAVGLATLIIAHNLGNDGDTMQMMQAVLDSNFWLATHVIAITLGYSAVFLAGGLAILWIVLDRRSARMTNDKTQMTNEGGLSRGAGEMTAEALGSGNALPARSSHLSFGFDHLSLTKMVYGVTCFALLLSFVGTVLGGIWADQSWGRFWGWDPKENGAALIVLITALILHARWGGLVRTRGMMVLAVGGNIVCAWSWFGTNMLGVGLHSYGFMDSAVFWLMAFIISQLAIMGWGMVGNAE